MRLTGCLSLYAIVLFACGGGGGAQGGGSVGPVPTTAPTPIPISSPSTAPSTAPPGPILTSASVGLSFVAIGTQYAQTVTVSESGYKGAFTTTNGCANIVSVAEVNASTYSVTPTGVGTCAFSFVDSFGDTGSPIATQVTTSVVVGS